MHGVRRWNIRKCSLLLSAAVILYVVVSSGGYHKYQIEGIISKAKPEKVWAYVADFNKMRLLNPTILDFKILADAGNAHDWRYTVQYTERLSHWPHWVNTAVAHYVVVKTLPDINPQQFIIESRHKTCFFGGFYCLHALSEFHFSDFNNGGTYAHEKIEYQCPPLLSTACRRELEFQRRAVMHNLTHIFGGN